MITFRFFASNGAASSCGLEIGWLDGRPAVLLTELASNQGMSVTNAVETIAEELLRAVPMLRGLDLQSVQWFETYEPTAYRRPQVWDSVVFTGRGIPTWKRLSAKPAIRENP